MQTVAKTLLVIAIILLAAVLISLLPTDQWFVRTVDLVREPLIYLALALLLAAFLVTSSKRWLTVAALIAVIAINLWRMWPYVPVAETQIALANEEAPADRCFTALSANVKVKNEGYGQVAEQIRQFDLMCFSSWRRIRDGLMRSSPF